eukprot:762763-Hanusia_phi.AAC.3
MPVDASLQLVVPFQVVGAKVHQQHLIQREAMRLRAFHCHPVGYLIPWRSSSNGLTAPEQRDEAGDLEPTEDRVPAPVPSPRMLAGPHRVELDAVLPGQL